MRAIVSSRLDKIRHRLGIGITVFEMGMSRITLTMVDIRYRAQPRDGYHESPQWEYETCPLD